MRTMLYPGGQDIQTTTTIITTVVSADNNNNNKVHPSQTIGMHKNNECAAIIIRWGNNATCGRKQRILIQRAPQNVNVRLFTLGNSNPRSGPSDEEGRTMRI